MPTVRPRQTCPVCGASLLVSTLNGHVGSVRCMAQLAENGGAFSDSDRGPRALGLVRELGRLMRAPSCRQEGVSS